MSVTGCQRVIVFSFFFFCCFLRVLRHGSRCQIGLRLDISRGWVTKSCIRFGTSFWQWSTAAPSHAKVCHWLRPDDDRNTLLLFFVKKGSQRSRGEFRYRCSFTAKIEKFSFFIKISCYGTVVSSTSI